MKFEKLFLQTLVSGDALTLPVFRFEGKDPKAPKAYLQANVHGSEIQGNALLYFLIQYLEKNPPLGDITLVPQANPMGASQKLGEYTLGRFDATKGLNWNRQYHQLACQNEDSRAKSFQLNMAQFAEKNLKSSEQEIEAKLNQELLDALKTCSNLNTGEKLTQALQTLSLGHQVILDLHTGPRATHYVYCPEYAKDRVRALGFPFVFMIPHDFAGAMDEASFHPWCLLQDELKKLGREFKIPLTAFTLELGSEERFSLAPEKLENVLALLYQQGVIEQEHKVEATSLAAPLDNFETLYAPTSGNVHFYKRPGELFKKGDLLAEFLQWKDFKNKISDCVTAYHAPYDGALILTAASSSLHEGMEFLGLLKDPMPLSLD